MLAWNVVKKFVYAFFENKSNDMAAKFGIFIRSTKSDDDIIEACSNLIQNSNSGGRITAVRKDKTYGGVKVYLNGNDIVQELIGKQFLFETGHDLSTIHPLTTHLTVHDAIVSTTEEEFIGELRYIIQEALGPVLKISKVPVSKLHPDIGNGNWRVLLDVPEIEDLDVYKKSGLPVNLTVKVPGVHGRLPITFYCTKCDKDGHTQWRCSENIEDETKAVSDSVKREDSTVATPSKPSSGFFIRDREDESREREVTPKNKPLLKIKNIKKFESEIGKEEVRNYCDSVHLKDSKDIKKEIGESSSSGINSEIKRRLFSGRDDREPNSKRARISPMIDDDNHSENLPKASSTTNDADSLEIPCGSSPSTPFKNQPNHFPFPSVGGLLTRNSVDDSVTTSNQPAPTVDTIKSELPSTDENDSDINQAPSRAKPVRQRKKPAQGIPIVIPDRIKNIILEIEDGVLNVEQLTAFFNHVKKKSKPCSFAEMYTSDVAGLKKQLGEIKRKYYMIPERGTNVEIQFMKWFVNILDRFDGTPSTRKKKAKA
ncbi:hypothetical protein AVEN_68489-1 [Araneus ventricosus]|uniref:Uncharacterized protein n=1 Tax=Araneus ventricosus TaxID=182803 RepID=A0A4Y2I5X2_ARAVE|nr:hypothetical protein AVEN_68489-1 [Araneus ventricosus]